MKKLLSTLILIASAICFAACSNTGGNGEYKVMVEASRNGKVECVQTVKDGGSVTFTLTPDEYYTVDALYVNGEDCELNGNTYTVNGVKSDLYVTATFKKVEYKVTVASGIENGSVSLSGSTAAYGEYAQVSVTPDRGYQVDKITAGEENITESKSFIVKGDTVVSVTFKKATPISVDLPKKDGVTLTVELEDGTVASEYFLGDKLVVKAIAERGKKCKTLKVGGKEVELVNGEYAFTLTKAVKFDAEVVSVNYVTFRGLDGTILSEVEVETGEKTVAPAIDCGEGEVIDGWKITNTEKNFDFSTEITGDYDLTANARKIRYTVNLIPCVDDIDVYALGFEYGESKSLKITEEDKKFKKTGYILVGWSATEDGDVLYPIGTEVENLIVNDGAEINLYAVWRTPSILFDGESELEVGENVKFAIDLSQLEVTGTLVTDWRVSENLKMTLGDPDENGIIGSVNVAAEEYGLNAFVECVITLGEDTVISRQPLAVYEKDHRGKIRLATTDEFISLVTANPNGTFYFKNDLTFVRDASADGRNDFKENGVLLKDFYGTIDGEGHSAYLADKRNGTGENFQSGWFLRINNGAVIENVRFVIDRIGRPNNSGLAGWLADEAIVRNCSFDVVIRSDISDGNTAGGYKHTVAGLFRSASGSLENCIINMRATYSPTGAMLGAETTAFCALSTDGLKAKNVLVFTNAERTLVGDKLEYDGVARGGYIQTEYTVAAGGSLTLPEVSVKADGKTYTYKYEAVSGATVNGNEVKLTANAATVKLTVSVLENGVTYAFAPIYISVAAK